MNKKITASVVSAFLLALPTLTMAQATVEAIGCKVARLVWIVFGIAAIAYFLWYGIMFLMARGDASKTQEARLGVLYGVVGIVVGVLALSAVSIIATFFGISGSVFTCGAF